VYACTIGDPPITQYRTYCGEAYKICPKSCSADHKYVIIDCRYVQICEKWKEKLECLLEDGDETGVWKLTEETFISSFVSFVEDTNEGDGSYNCIPPAKCEGGGCVSTPVSPSTP
jgi:hypothetical protein